jgi:3-oxoacyl-[acyl-carrier-protein] synthase II
LANAILHEALEDSKILQSKLGQNHEQVINPDRFGMIIANQFGASENYDK